MSKSVQLVGRDGRPLEAPTRERGGTFSLTGPPRMDLSVTGNYHPIIVDATGWDDGIRELHGRRAGDTVEELRAAAQLLKRRRSDTPTGEGSWDDDGRVDYWDATPGNVARVFSTLLDWAQQRPDGTWRVI